MMVYNKYKLYLHNGLSQQEASEKALKEADSIIKDMDSKLAQCIEKLTPQDIQQIFGIEKRKKNEH